MKNQDCQLHTQRKNSQSLSSVSSSTPVAGIFESRPFIVQQKQQENSQQPNLKASLMGAERYGHHLARMKPAGLFTGTQQSMGQATGANFSGASVHTEVQSDQWNQSMQAKAFRRGQDVFFRQGELNGESRGGQELLADEKTQVVQHKGAVLQCTKDKLADDAPDEYKKVASSSGNLGHKRQKTAFGYVNAKKNNRLQGPHTVAHITTSSALAIGEKKGYDTLKLLGTKVAPRPRVANKILKAEVQSGGRLTDTREQRTKYLRKYQDLYSIANNPQVNKDKRVKAMKELIELSPTGTYGLDTGVVTPANMAGKGERRTGAVRDLLEGKSMKKGNPIPLGVTTFDGGTSSTNTVHGRAANDRFRQISQYAAGEPLSPADSIGSETDSVVSNLQ
jgi:hypothetical protein